MPRIMLSSRNAAPERRALAELARMNLQHRSYLAERFDGLRLLHLAARLLDFHELQQRFNNIPQDEYDAPLAPIKIRLSLWIPLSEPARISTFPLGLQMTTREYIREIKYIVSTYFFDIYPI